LARRSQRNRKRGPANNVAKSAMPPAAQTTDRYEKYLPEWMKGTNGAPPPRPARPRRQRPRRPAGGYTPGKLALGDGTIL
jgi:hypothetical protein